MTTLVIHHNANNDKCKYYDRNGLHFTKESYEYAVSFMKDSKGNSIAPISISELSKKMSTYNVEINTGELYDCCYVYCMGKADFLNSSLPDEYHLLLYVKDMLEDADAPDGYIFNRWLADMGLKDEYVDWSEML